MKDRFEQLGHCGLVVAPARHQSSPLQLLFLAVHNSEQHTSSPPLASPRRPAACGHRRRRRYASIVYVSYSAPLGVYASTSNSEKDVAVLAFCLSSCSPSPLAVSLVLFGRHHVSPTYTQ